MKIAVCDDEPYFQKQIKEELEGYYQSLDMLVQIFSSGEELITAVEKEPFSFYCIFLDIEMPGMDGLAAARRIYALRQEITVILLTSHVEYAMTGYEMNVFRFLSKPLNPAKLGEALKALEECSLYEKKIVLPDNGREIYFPCRDIYYIKSENVYIRFVTKNDTYLVRRKLKQQMEELPERFFYQPHRCFIINLLHVQAYDGKYVIMKDNTSVPVSRGRQELLKKTIMHYLKGLQ